MTGVIVPVADSDYGSDIPVSALSDYGSDIDLDDVEEDAIWGPHLIRLATSAPVQVTYRSTETVAQVNHVAARTELQDTPGKEHVGQSNLLVARSPRLEFEYDARSRGAFSVLRGELPSQIHPIPHPTTTAHNDVRTPLERFRAKPRKPLSVTDLVSPAWCELQYSYTLSKFGRKPRTQAMKQGTQIHRALEDEIFPEAIVIETASNEDRFGLRIWNTIQRLRTLRETGLTRELEIWGIIEGQVVNGVVDELSFVCPDSDTKGAPEMLRAQESSGTRPSGQTTIQPDGGSLPSQGDVASVSLGTGENEKKVYVCDVKTRSQRSLPSKAASRQTRMQLMLYRKLLESLSLNTVNAESVFERYGLAPLTSFSESFLSGFDDKSDEDVQFDSKKAHSVIPMNELRSYPNLLSLWSLMISDVQQTITTISDTLRAEYRYAKTGEVIGNELMVYSARDIDAYIEQEMEWWKGAREAKGVEIEEAFKCQKCDFADMCTWRKDKIEEATEKHRLRKRAREKSEV